MASQSFEKVLSTPTVLTGNFAPGDCDCTERNDLVNPAEHGTASDRRRRVRDDASEPAATPSTDARRNHLGLVYLYSAGWGSCNRMILGAADRGSCIRLIPGEKNGGSPQPTDARRDQLGVDATRGFSMHGPTPDSTSALSVLPVRSECRIRSQAAALSR